MELLLKYDFGAVVRPVAYLFQLADSDLIKVGYARNLKSRYKQLQEAVPYPLLIVGFKEFDHVDEAAKYEAYLHWRLAAYRIRGEWYQLPASKLDEITNETSPMPISREARTIRWVTHRPPPPPNFKQPTRRHRNIGFMIVPEPLWREIRKKLAAGWSDLQIEREEKRGPNCGRIVMRI